MAYSYARSIKSKLSDEPVNTLLIRPLAGLIVRGLYGTPVRPNHVTVVSIVAGILAAALYGESAAGAPWAAGLWLTFKDILDSADGQLARVGGTSSRAGRFLDSIGDLVVNFTVFVAIGIAFAHTPARYGVPWLCGLAFAGMTLRVSYHVFYHTAYLHLEEKYQINRLTEEIQSSDLQEGRTTIMLQRVFQFLYGWQDRWMLRLDNWSRHGRSLPSSRAGAWYGDLTGLRFTGMMGLGSELFFLMLFSVAGAVEYYLWFNVVGLNTWWAMSVGYRRRVLAHRVAA